MTNYADELAKLWRQQVEAGFVIFDPIGNQPANKKYLFDLPKILTFSVIWSPAHAFRNDYGELVKRGLVAPGADEALLINKTDDGRACFLCPENISLQNPKEVLLKLSLAGNQYLAGANIVPITNNHFTVMSAEHHPQPPGYKMISVLIDATELTDGGYRAVFNGTAGASIVAHEHFHITTSHFPVEQMRIEPKDIVWEAGGVRVSRPEYYVPLSIIEGIDRYGTEQAAKNVIAKWRALDEENHTENIIAAKEGPIYRIHIFHRNKRKLKSSVKSGALSAFECGGIIVLSGKDEELFKKISLESVQRMLADIAP